MRRFLLASALCLVGFGALAQTNSGPPPSSVIPAPAAFGPGPVNSNAAVWINPNANAASVSAPPSGSGLTQSGADGASDLLVLDSYGGGNSIQGRRADGIAASKTGVVANDSLVSFSSVGWTSAAAYSPAAAVLRAIATETWSGTQVGSAWTFQTTAAGTLTLGEAMRIQPSGGLSIGTTTDPGIGSLQINGQQFMPNVTTSSAAQTGTVCWTTGTGKLTVDTTLGCLASLEELKDKKGSILNAMDEINRLEPFWYSWKEGTPERAGDTHVQPGLGAHQVESVDPRLVGYGTDGKLSGVRYTQMVALLVAGMKELKADNDDLRREMVIMRHQASEKKRAK